MTEENSVSSLQWWQKNWVQNLGFVLAAVIGVYVLIYIDVVARAREAYREGEKYMAWNRDPAQKKQYFDEKFEEEKAALDKQLRKKKITDETYQEKMDILKFDREFNLEESSLKYAYQWYKDTYELFSPPESKWVRLARAKEPQALALWKKELREQKIPFEDTMFE